MKNNSLVFIQNDTPLTTSRTVAEQFDKNHRDVLREIDKLVGQMASQSQSAKLRSAQLFIKTTYQAEEGGRKYPQYLMTRDGFSLLAMGFTGKKALEFKLKFIDAFNRMEEALSVPQIDTRWAQTRQNTKISHKPFTYAIKLMLAYLNDHCGRKYNEGYVYGHITNIVQNACGIIKGQRDGATVANLNKCDQCQSMTANLILNIIALKTAESLEDFEAQIILQLSNLNNLLGGQPVLFLNGGGQ